MSPPAWTRQAWFRGAASTLLIVIGFVAYAAQSTDVFETRALIVVEPADGLTGTDLLRRARELERIVADPNFVAARGQAGAARPLDEGGVWIEAVDATTFAVNCQGPDPHGVAKTCDQVASATVQSAPPAVSSRLVQESRVGQAVRALSAFARSHPGATASPSALPPEEHAAWNSKLNDVRAAMQAQPLASLPAVAVRIKTRAPPGSVIGLGQTGTLLVGLVFASMTGLFIMLLEYVLVRQSLAPTRDLSESPVPAPSSVPDLRAEPDALSRLALTSNRQVTPAAPEGAPPPSVEPPEKVEALPPPAPVPSFPGVNSAPRALPEVSERTARPAATGTDSGFPASVQNRALLPVTHRTQMLGSPTPPPPLAGPGSLQSLEEAPGSTSTRYSFVSTLPPAGGDPVRSEEVGPDWSPAESLEPAYCAPLCREIFAFGVESCFVLGVTSTPGDESDKSEFAASLALALGASGHARVLLVEADLSRPTQHELMRARMPAGATLSRQLQTRMTRQSPEPWCVLRCTKSLHLLVDGPEATPGLILSRTFEECVRAMRAYYDFLVLDGPSGARDAECRALDGVIDGLLVVCSEDHRGDVAATSRRFTSKRFSKAIRARP